MCYFSARPSWCSTLQVHCKPSSSRNHSAERFTACHRSYCTAGGVVQVPARHCAMDTGHKCANIWTDHSLLSDHARRSRALSLQHAHEPAAQQSSRRAPLTSLLPLQGACCVLLLLRTRVFGCFACGTRRNCTCTHTHAHARTHTPMYTLAYT